MKILVLSSSRADYSIYLPLLKLLKKDPFFDVKIVAFGTHNAVEYGRTIVQFSKDGFNVDHPLNCLFSGDTPTDIASAIGKTTLQFSPIWESEKETDLILCLGDRFEMFAAVAASVPFSIPVAHIHGGETTLGAIDNVFRDALTTMACLHFASTSKHAERVAAIKGSSKNVYNVGALSLDNLNNLELLDAGSFEKQFGIYPDNPILVTFHPETVAYAKNEHYADELIAALDTLNQQIIITMPNADTSSSIIRKKLLAFADKKALVHTVESLGMQGYFSCLNVCDFVLGNSSSGIIEAASFGKYVVNIGDRQKGRDSGKNVLHCEAEKNAILDAIETARKLPNLGKYNIYGDGNSAERIIEILKEIQV